MLLKTQKTTLLALLALGITISLTNYGEAAAPGFDNRSVTGGFVQLTNSNALNGNAWWKAQVQEMAGLGMDTLVVQYSAFDGVAFYPQNRAFTTTLNGIESSVNAHNPIRAILEETDLQGVEVYLGVYQSSSFDNYLTQGSNNGSDIVQTTIGNAKNSLADLDSNYGWDPNANGGSGASRYDSLAGWYFPQEINNFVALTASPWNHDREIIDYTKQLSNYADSTTGLNTMISPYFNLNQEMVHNNQTYADWWKDEALDTASGGFDVDIIALQDGVGAGIVGHNDPGLRRHATVLTAPAEFAAIKSAICQSSNASLWANVEAFDRTAQNSAQANFTRFRNQITSVASAVEKTIQFDYPHYLASNALNLKYQGTGGIPTATDNLYVKYDKYADAEETRVDIDGYWYEPDFLGGAFHSQAGDPGEALLEDLNTGALDVPVGGSTFLNGTWVGFDKNNSTTTAGGASNANPEAKF